GGAGGGSRADPARCSRLTVPADGDMPRHPEPDKLRLATPPRAGAWLLAISLVLISFNLRAAVSSVGPVLRDIIATTGLSAAGASVLTTLPSLCFGLAALAATGLSRRLGPERAVLAGLAALTGGLVLRGTTGLSGLFAGQVAATAGIGVINVLLPGLVKRDFPRRVALMTGLYTMAFCAGAAAAAGATVPLALLLGGWGAGWPSGRCRPRSPRWSGRSRCRAARGSRPMPGSPCAD